MTALVVSFLYLLVGVSSFGVVKVTTKFQRDRRRIFFSENLNLSFDLVQELEDVSSKKPFDAVVCGAGPGGLLLASALSKHGCSICVVDPALDRPWPNNYGVWMDEAVPFGYKDCVDKVWNEVGVIFDEKTPELVLGRPYGRVDRKKMKGRLIDECIENGVRFSCAKAIDLVHFDDKCSEVTLRSGGANATVKAILVADATGFSRQFVQHDTTFDPGFQNTYGARFRVKDLGPYKLDRMVLMDYSEMHLHDDSAMKASNDRFPSFVYAMPLGPNELFLEETVLVSRPGAPFKDLEARLYKRMIALGIEPLEILEDERAAIPMGGADPVVPQRTLGFGATSSLVHPASGYMVARAMEIAPRVADAVAPKLKGLTKKLDNGETITKNELDAVAIAGWDAVWPADERRQRDFMHFGFELLCLLSPQELRDFFTGFFRLPDALWEHFLSWRLSGIGHVVMGLRVWAQCIPRRFMPAMLIKSLPFLGNRLVIPFASRGDYSPIDTMSVYWDAPSGGESREKWEPERYREYLAELHKMDLGDAQAAEQKIEENMEGELINMCYEDAGVAKQKKEMEEDEYRDEDPEGSDVEGEYFEGSDVSKKQRALLQLDTK